MGTKMQLLKVLAIAVMATHLVSSVSSSRLLPRSNSAVAADATSAGEHDSLPDQDFHDVTDFQQLSGSTTSSKPETTPRDTDYGNHTTSPAKTSTSSETFTTESTDSGTTTAPYFPDYETHDNSPGFNGRRR